MTCRTRGKSALPLDSPDRMPGRFSPAKSRSGHQLKAGLGRASAWLTAVRSRKDRVPTRGAGSDAGMVELSVFEQRFGNSRSLGARTEHRVRGQRTARSHTMVRIFALRLIVAPRSRMQLRSDAAEGQRGSARARSPAPALDVRSRAHRSTLGSR